MVEVERIELSISGCKPDVFPLALTAQSNIQLISLYTVCQGEIGSPAWDRTTDTLINSQVQLPLCYWGIKLIWPRAWESNPVTVLLRSTDQQSAALPSCPLSTIYLADTQACYKNLVDRGRIELPTEACKATVIPFNYQPKFGIPRGTRTPTNGFGDRHAAITSERHLIL